MLEVKDLNVYYGNIHALKGISFSVKKGEIVTLIGANGAGKTTILHTVSGLIKPKKGSIRLREEKIDGMSPDKILLHKMSHVPEGRRVFAEMTVKENLEMGAYTRRDKKEIKKDMEEMYLRFPKLKERRKQLAGTMSGGEQQMLAIARGLMSRPEILLLDEPSMGLAPMLVKEIFDIIVEINKKGTTILLVEQNATMALKIADRAYVLETGNIINSGKAEDLLDNDDVKRAYLGS